MGRIYEEVGELTGNTPLLHMRKLEERYQLPATILAKLEYLNPSGSIKDRAALAMIRDAEERGLVKTRGNNHRTYIRKYRDRSGIRGDCKRISGDIDDAVDMSGEKKYIKSIWRKNRFNRGCDGNERRYRKGGRTAAGDSRQFIPGQFDNPANARIHRETTGPESGRTQRGRWIFWWQA